MFKITSLNPYGLPYFKSFFNYIEKNYDSDFYGYINGDILQSSYVYDVLSNIHRRIKKKEISSAVFFFWNKWLNRSIWRVNDTILIIITTPSWNRWSLIMMYSWSTSLDWPPFTIHSPWYVLLPLVFIPRITLSQPKASCLDLKLSLWWLVEDGLIHIYWPYWSSRISRRLILQT